MPVVDPVTGEIVDPLTGERYSPWGEIAGPQVAAMNPMPAPGVKETGRGPVISPDANKMMSDLNTLQMKRIGEQEKGISREEGLLDALRSRQPKAQASLQPLAGLVDAWTGSHLAGGFPSDQDLHQKQTQEQLKLLDLENRLQERKKDLTGSQQKLLETNFRNALMQQKLGVSQAKDAAKPTKGQEALDRSFAKEYDEFVARGGAADMQKSLDQLKDSRARLANTPNATGPTIGALPRALKNIVSPESTAIQEQIEEVVQRNLRAILGAQFTEKEGERLIARAYNPSLPQPENIKRLDRLIGQLQKAADAKIAAAKYFEDKGTLTGFKGTAQPSISLEEEPAADKKQYPATMVGPDGKNYKHVGGGEYEEVK